ncbi:hypothetical protein I302_103559 [Kwoniella bestiolae CBS 10118]|uniref:Uncharacterized protein n=1 Tax=Kwoniella bestiolae CBS 10118 TaxID=1296100 RepID=A0A1B9G8Q7_9TREE|nr:hypothetical protein I302_02260 [Kwoniella bestiolae CBS 10118]OCF27418.1 hypothetical protein I302_02260 [Kwoniella bestiolae CBS 10118]
MASFPIYEQAYLPEYEQDPSFLYDDYSTPPPVYVEGRSYEEESFENINISDTYVEYEEEDELPEAWIPYSGYSNLPPGNGNQQVIIGSPFPQPSALKQHYCDLYPEECNRVGGLLERNTTGGNGTLEGDVGKGTSLNHVDLSGCGVALLLLLLILLGLNGGWSGDKGGSDPRKTGRSDGKGGKGSGDGKDGKGGSGKDREDRSKDSKSKNQGETPEERARRKGAEKKANKHGNKTGTGKDGKGSGGKHGDGSGKGDNGKHGDRSKSNGRSNRGETPEERDQRKAQERADRKAKDDAAKKAQRDADRKARRDAEKKAQQAQDRADRHGDRNGRDGNGKHGDRNRGNRSSDRGETPEERDQRKARDRANKKAKDDAARKAKRDAEKKAQQEQDRADRHGDGSRRSRSNRPSGETSEERKARKAKEEADRKAKDDAAKKAQRDADRTAQKAQKAAEKKAEEDAANKAQRDADRKAKYEADKKAKAEADKKAKDDAAKADKKAKDDADRKAKYEADKKAKAEADKKAREDAAQKAQKEADKKAKGDSDSSWISPPLLLGLLLLLALMGFAGKSQIPQAMPSMPNWKWRAPDLFHKPSGIIGGGLLSEDGGLLGNGGVLGTGILKTGPSRPIIRSSPKVIPSRSKWMVNEPASHIHINNVNSQGNGNPITFGESHVVVEEGIPVVEVRSEPEPIIVEDKVWEPINFRFTGPTNPDRLLNMLLAALIVSLPLLLDWIRDYPDNRYDQPDYISSNIQLLILAGLILFGLLIADWHFGWTTTIAPYAEVSVDSVQSGLTPVLVGAVETTEQLVWGLEDVLFGDSRVILGMGLAALGVFFLSQREPDLDIPATDFANSTTQAMVFLGALLLGMLLWNA